MGPKKKHPGKKVNKAAAGKRPSARKEATSSTTTSSNIYPLIQARLNNYKLDVVKSRQGWAIDISTNFSALKNYGIVYGHEEHKSKEWVCLVTTACAESCDNQGWKMKLHFNEEKNRCVNIKG